MRVWSKQKIAQWEKGYQKIRKNGGKNENEKGSKIHCAESTIGIIVIKTPWNLGDIEVFFCNLSCSETFRFRHSRNLGRIFGRTQSVCVRCFIKPVQGSNGTRIVHLMSNAVLFFISNASRSVVSSSLSEFVSLGIPCILSLPCMTTKFSEGN